MSCGRILLTGVLLSSAVMFAKDKKTAPFPVDVLQARTVWVIVDPAAGVDIENPNVNQTARADVEKALVKWGRLEPVTDPQQADLIITVRKGLDKIADGTLGGTQINRPPSVIGESTNNGIHGAGGSRGGPFPENPTDASAGPNDGFPAGSSYPNRPTPQAELGSSQDTFTVYRSKVHDALNAPPVWRYTARDSLDSPDVPAVTAFHDRIAASEKQLSKTP